MLSESIFERLNREIAINVKLSLIAHGHKFSGELENSIKAFVSKENGNFKLEAQSLDYIDDLEFGISPESFEESKVDIDKLTSWIKSKSWNKKKPTARGLIKLWKQRGFELSGANSYSLTGSSTESIKYSFDAYWNDYIKRLDDISFKEIDNEFFKTKSGVIK